RVDETAALAGAQLWLVVEAAHRDAGLDRGGKRVVELARLGRRRLVPLVAVPRLATTLAQHRERRRLRVGLGLTLGHGAHREAAGLRLILEKRVDAGHPRAVVELTGLERGLARVEGDDDLVDAVVMVKLSVVAAGPADEQRTGRHDRAGVQIGEQR